MTGASIWAIVLWGMIAGLDLVSVGQVMIGRPFVAGTVAGALMGDLPAGAVVGVVMELFALDLLPVGAVRYPDYGPATVAAAATAAGAPGILGLGPAIVVGLVVGYLGELAMQLVRRLNSADARQCSAYLDGGDARAIRGFHYRGIVRDAVRALGVTLCGLTLAWSVRRWLPLDLRGAVLAATVALGAALAVGITGILRLNARGRARSWLAAGLAVGLMWIWVR